MKVGLAVRQPLRQVNRIAGLDQHVQAPARDALALGLDGSAISGMGNAG